MSEKPERVPTQQELDRFAAEAAKHQAEARKFSAEAAEAEARAAIADIELGREIQKRERERHADDYADRTYRYLSGIDDSSVKACIAKLDAWHRDDPGCDITIIFDSPGGHVVAGFHLFDHILGLRESGHRIDTMTRGYAASMAGILVQAGETRIMGPNATLMLHEVSFGAQGKIGDVEDTTEFAKMLWNRALDIFAERCKGAADETATKRMSRRTLDARSRRKNWWIKSSDALAYGLVDEIR